MVPPHSGWLPADGFRPNRQQVGVDADSYRDFEDRGSASTRELPWMRLTLANRISISVIGVVALGVLSSVVALLSTRHVAHLMRQAIDENLQSVRAAEELEIAVLEQRGFVSSYLLDDGNPHWLTDLKLREENYGRWLAVAQATARTPQEHALLKQLDEVYRQYDAARDRVVQLYDQGEVAAAERLLLEDVAELYDKAHGLCERFIAHNEQLVNEALEGVDDQIRWVTWMARGIAALTIGLGVALLAVFFVGVVYPLRAAVADARGFSEDAAEGGNGLPTDELRAVGTYLRNLMSDVTDARTAVERSRGELREAEKLASVGKLAASVAHEIRNPLTSIKMWLFSIQKDVRSHAALDHKFQIVADEIKRLENIVHNFLEFSRRPDLRLSTESISSIVDKTLELIEPRAQDQGIYIDRHDTAPLPLVRGDAEQLRQVLLNLLNNALEAVGRDGWMGVSTTYQTGTDVPSMVIVRVANSGPGIPQEVAARVFEPFFSTKEGGTGLGLSIAARIMARHGGRLVLESSNQQGTTFALYIPTASIEQT